MVNIKDSTSHFGVYLLFCQETNVVEPAPMIGSVEFFTEQYYVDSRDIQFLIIFWTVHPLAVRSFTPPKFNIVPEKWCLEDDFPFRMAYFQGRTVKLPGSIFVAMTCKRRRGLLCFSGCKVKVRLRGGVQIFPSKSIVLHPWKITCPQKRGPFQ